MPRGGRSREEERLPNDAMRPPGRPRGPGRAGGALRERGHGGGDRPIPSRTRQLSPPSPKVLRIRSAGGRDAALAQGASAPIGGRARAGEGPQGPFRASRGPSGPLSFFRGALSLFCDADQACIYSISFYSCILGRYVFGKDHGGFKPLTRCFKEWSVSFLVDAGKPLVTRKPLAIMG